MKLRIIILTLLITFTSFLSGCWDYEEYEDLIQVSAVGIDYDKKSKKVTLTVQYIPTTKGGQTGGGGGGGQAAGSTGKTEIVHSATDKTLYEAVAKIQQVIFKKLFYGYLKVIVIGEDAARYKMKDIIELLDRTPAIRSTSYIVITPGKAEDTTSTYDAALVGSSSEEIFNLINIGGTSGAAYPVTVQRLAEMLAVPGIEASVPRVITVSKIPQLDAKGGTQGNVRYDVEREGDHRLVGLAAFKGDKLVGWMDEKETLGYGWITGKKILAYKVSQTSGNADTENMLFYLVLRAKGKIKVQIENGKPNFQVDVKVVADLRKYYTRGGSDFLTPKEVRVMEKKLSDSIKSDIKAALKKGQKGLKSDIFGFGFALFREDTKLWRTKYERAWGNIYPDIPVTINVKAKLINTGTNIRRLDLR